MTTPTPRTEPIAPAETSHRTRMIDGLIDLAAFLEANPAVPVARFGWTLAITCGVSLDTTTDLRQRNEIDRIADLLDVPVCDETTEGGHYQTRRHFGPVTYEATHIPARQMAAHYAHMSYRANVTPDPAHAAREAA